MLVVDQQHDSWCPHPKVATINYNTPWITILRNTVELLKILHAEEPLPFAEWFSEFLQHFFERSPCSTSHTVGLANNWMLPCCAYQHKHTHKTNPYADRSVKYLLEKHCFAINELASRTTDVRDPAKYDNIWLMRFAAANDGDIDAAEQDVREAIAWREGEGVHVVLNVCEKERGCIFCASA